MKQLDETRPESVYTARDSLRKLMPESDIDERDKMFRGFRAFYARSVYTTNAAFTATMGKYVNDDEQWLTKSSGLISIQQIRLLYSSLPTCLTSAWQVMCAFHSRKSPSRAVHV